MKRNIVATVLCAGLLIGFAGCDESRLWKENDTAVSSESERTLPETSESESLRNIPAESGSTDSESESESLRSIPAESDSADSESESESETTVFDPESWRNSVVDTSDTQYTYEAMTEDLQILAQRYPEIFSCRSIGTSWDGRTLYAATLGNPNAPKQIIVTAAIHAREYVTALLVMAQAEYYLENYRIGTYDGVPFEELFSECAIVIVPMVNPDGVSLAQRGIASVMHEDVKEMLMKAYRSDEKWGLTKGSSGMDGYFRTWKANLAGVDLNRNYDTDAWKDQNKILAPSMQNFRGYSPMSEPETLALASLTESLSNPVASLCMHSQGEVIYWNCDQDGDLKTRSRELANLTRSLNGYKRIDAVNLDASYSDWCILEKGIPAITVEIGDGKGSSLLAKDQIPVIWKANRDLWCVYAKYLMD